MAAAAAAGPGTVPVTDSESARDPCGRRQCPLAAAVTVTVTGPPAGGILKLVVPGVTHHDESRVTGTVRAKALA